LQDRSGSALDESGFLRGGHRDRELDWHRRLDDLATKPHEYFGLVGKRNRREPLDQILEKPPKHVCRHISGWGSIITDLDLRQHPRQLRGGHSSVFFRREREMLLNAQPGFFERSNIDEIPR
jgi:hypothetical protein